MLRFSFKPPRYLNSIGVNPNSMIKLCHPHHPLKEVAGTFVNALRICCTSGPSEIQLQIFNIYGPVCSSLMICKIPSQYADPVSEMAVDCRHLKNLSIHLDPKIYARSEDYPFWSLLAMQSGLEKLVVRGTMLSSVHAFESVAEFGAGLKQLEMDMRVSNLNCKSSMTRMFEAIGNTLFSLKLLFRKDEPGTEADRFDVKNIVGLCPHIADLYIYLRLPLDNPLYEQRKSLICSYGAQIRHIDRFGMSKEYLDAMGNVDEGFLRRLRSDCPNLAVKLLCAEQKAVTVLNILGPLVHSLGYEESQRYLRMDTSAKRAILQSALAMCCNLGTVNIGGWCGPKGCLPTMTLFSSAKPKLRTLRLRQNPKVQTPMAWVADGIEAVARNTGALKSLHIVSPRLEPRLLRRLALANRHLEKIQFETHIDGVVADSKKAGYGEYLIEIIESFSICRALTSISLETSLERTAKIDERIVAVEDACVRIRQRNIIVRLDSIDYCRTKTRRYASAWHPPRVSADVYCRDENGHRVQGPVH